jgi:hypothetical protein
MIGGERAATTTPRVPIRGAGCGPAGGRFNLQDVLAASLLSFGVIAEVRRIEAQLLSDEGA